MVKPVRQEIEDIRVLIRQFNWWTVFVVLFTQDILEVGGLLAKQARVHIKHDVPGPNVQGCNVTRKGAV